MLQNKVCRAPLRKDERALELRVPLPCLECALGVATHHVISRIPGPHFEDVLRPLESSLGRLRRAVGQHLAYIERNASVNAGFAKALLLTAEFVLKHTGVQLGGEEGRGPKEIATVVRCPIRVIAIPGTSLARRLSS